MILFQFGATYAGLELPTLNADIINNGVARGDTGYILTYGGWMLLVSAAQVFCQVSAVYLGSRMAMSFGRDARTSLFKRVLSFSVVR